MILYNLYIIGVDIRFYRRGFKIIIIEGSFCRGIRGYFFLENFKLRFLEVGFIVF